MPDTELHKEVHNTKKEYITEDNCPICAKHRNPKTGELRFNDEVMEGMQEVEDMLSGKIPVKWHNTLEDLNKILEL